MRYVVLDVETGGLDRARCCIMEVAMIALDENFVPLGEYTQPVNVREQPGDAFEEGAIKLHRSTGLFDDCMACTNAIGSIDADACAWLSSLGFAPAEMSSQAQAMTIGRKPEFDRAFVERQMPALDRFFHYRMIDVTTVVQVAAMAAGMMSDRLKAALSETEQRGGQQHRALEDCRLALRQFSFLAKHYNGAALLSELRAMGKIG